MAGVVTITSKQVTIFVINNLRVWLQYIHVYLYQRLLLSCAKKPIVFESRFIALVASCVVIAWVRISRVSDTKGDKNSLIELSDYIPS